MFSRLLTELLDKEGLENSMGFAELDKQRTVMTYLLSISHHDEAKESENHISKEWKNIMDEFFAIYFLKYHQQSNNTLFS